MSRQASADTAATPRRTPLEEWVAAAIGCAGGRVHRAALADWQLARLRETVARARQHSPFYARHLAAHDAGDLASLADLATLPFTTADHLRVEGPRMLCVRPDEIERIVTLPTSGTTGQPKRVFFTAEDLELTVDFFHHGMSTFTNADDRVLVLMPGERPGSVGELLSRALPRLGAAVEVHGPVRDVGAALDALARLRATVVVGIPAQVLTLARRSTEYGEASWRPRVVLLSADRAPRAVRQAIEDAWSCRVFDHYGSTEMGFGGGVECEARDGYHLREADLLFEVISLTTGLPARPGETGEVVFTTLTRTGMPLIRYRTGDLSATVPAACSCGARLPLLAHVKGRIADGVRLSRGPTLTLGDLDDALLGIGGIADFRATVDRASDGERLRVELRLTGSQRGVVDQARRALLRVPALREGNAAGKLRVEVDIGDEAQWPCSTGMTKRTLCDERGMERAHA